MSTLAIIKQHLIDPEICIRCNTCEETCPIDAITHDDRNYVVDASICNGCMACIAPCPTGSIDNWRQVLKADAYSTAAQLEWDILPEQAALPAPDDAVTSGLQEHSADAGPGPLEVDSARGSSVPPWSAAQPAVNLYTHKAPIMATVVGSYRLTDASASSDIRHIVLDFGTLPFPVLEGQSIGILPPGVDSQGKPHHARQYSIASPRDGERRGYNNLSLTVKRVDRDFQGNAMNGVCSNFLCDLKKGDTVTVIGPFGSTFLMPNHPNSHLLMICTGTGSAPMRAMTEYRRRHRLDDASGKLMLFFGARTKEELPYFGPLLNLPKDFIDIELAFSRTAGEPKRYVQDAMRARSADVARFLADASAYVYVCGLKQMEDGVLQALAEIADLHGAGWPELWAKLRREGRLHLETY
jgi:benzoyl-CoA 2,3-dioxygenase component A